MAAPQAAGRFKEVGEEDIKRLRGMTLFDIIKQMQHLCGVASMIVSPSCFALGWQSSLGGYYHAGHPTEMLHLFNGTQLISQSENHLDSIWKSLKRIDC